MKTFESEIKNISEDNFSGSQSITIAVIDALVSLLKRGHLDSMNELVNLLVSVQHHFSKFAGLFNFINNFFLEIENGKHQEQLIRYLIHYRDNLNDMSARLSGSFIEHYNLNGKKILLHSNSSAVKDLIKLAYERKIKPSIYQTISEPAGEGKLQASYFADLGIKVTLFHENNTALYLNDSDTVILGADLVSGEIFINKSGSYPIALLAQKFNKPVYVLCHSEKLVQLDSLPKKLKENFLSEALKPSSELWNDAPETIIIENRYFETIPNSLVTQFITESRNFDPTSLARAVHAKKVSKLFHLT